MRDRTDEPICNGDTGIEDRLKDTEGGRKERERCIERVPWKYLHYCK